MFGFSFFNSVSPHQIKSQSHKLSGRSDQLWSNLSLITWVLSEGSSVVADTGAVGGSHENLVHLPTDQIAQRAVGAGAVAAECLCIAGGFHIVAHCIRTGGPGHLSHASSTHQPAGHIRRRTRLWRGNQIKQSVTVNGVFVNDSVMTT